ncbi:MAG: hypothetical protein OEV50_04970, partial [Candidatus Aminicenantes bacterium]|nr:hypothetical protein [Candidatus Aminicenantes bacterium]
MFSKRKCSFTRNIAILVCVALVTMIVPEATHAAASSSKGGSSSSKDSFPISSSVLSAAGLAISLVVYQLYYQYVLSGGSTSSTL